MTSVPPEEPGTTFPPFIVLEFGDFCIGHLKFGIFLCRKIYREMFKRQWNPWTRALACCGGEVAFYFLRQNYKPSSIIMTTLFSAGRTTWTFFACYHYASLLCELLTLHRFFFCCCNGRL